MSSKSQWLKEALEAAPEGSEAYMSPCGKVAVIKKDKDGERVIAIKHC